MSRKYLYFKICSNLKDTIESDRLSEYEISVFLDDYNVIQNVLQLNHNAELNLLIKKSNQLQNLLTDSLPDYGLRHGYLWSGDTFPEFTKFLSKCGLIDSCIAFQKITDPLPGFKHDPFFQLSYRFEIYNWYIYCFKSFQYYLETSSRIRALSDSESEIDWAFESLWNKQKLFSHERNSGASQKTEISQLQSGYKYIIQNKQKYSTRNGRWIRALLNYLNPDNEGVLYIPFAGKSDIFTEAVLSGGRMLASDINPLKQSYLEVNSHIFKIDLQQLGRAVADIVGQIKTLITGQSTVQSDLFINSIEKQFAQFWQIEQNRINKSINPDISSKHIKCYAAVRFLIESQSISKSGVVNSVLLSGLINLIKNTFQKHSSVDLIEAYHHELRQIYLDIYVFHKIKLLNRDPGSLEHFYLENALELKSIPDNSIRTICGFFPARLKKNDKKSDEIFIDILNWINRSKTLNKHKMAYKIVDEEEKQWWIEEITDKGNLFSLLGFYGKNILTRILEFRRDVEAASFFKLWINGYYFLNECSRILEKNGRACILTQNTSIKLESTFEEINSMEIFKELITKHEKDMNLRILESFRKQSHQTYFGKTDYYNILFLNKY